MFEFQILRYEGLENPEELLVELSSSDNPDQIQTICHQDFNFKDESTSECENAESLISIPSPGLLSILLYKQGQEFGVFLNSDLLLDIRTAEFLPLFSPAREIESLEEDSPIRVLVAVQKTEEDTSNFFTQFSFYLYRQYSDLRKTSNIESQEFMKKLRNQEFELLKAQNDFNVFRAFQEEKVQMLESSHQQDMIVRNNMEAVVSDLEAQNFNFEQECQRLSKKVEIFTNVVSCLNEEKEKMQGFNDVCLDEFQGKIMELVGVVEESQKEKLQKENFIKKLQFEKKMLEQSLTLEKLRNQGKNARENFYLIFKDFLNKETSGSLEKIVEKLELLIKKLIKKNTKYSVKIEELEGKIMETQKDYKNLESSLSEKILNKSEKKRGIKQNLSQIQEKLQKKQQKILILKQNFSAEISKNAKEQENLKNIFTAEKKDLLTEIQSLKTRFECEKSSLIIKHQKDLKDLEVTCQRTKDDFDKDKKELVEDCNKKIIQLNKKHENEKKKTAEDHETSLNNLRSSFNQEKKKILEEKLEESRENERVLNQIKSKFEADRKKMVADQNDLVTEHEKVLNQIKAKFETDNKKYLNEKNEMIAEHEKNIKQLIFDFESTKSRLLKEKNEIITENSKNLAALIEKFELEKTTTSQARQEEVNQYEKTIKTLKTQKDVEKQKFLSEIEEIKQAHAVALHSNTLSLQSEYKKQLESQSEFFSSEKSQLITHYESEKSRITSENLQNSKKLESLLLKAQETHESQMKSLKLSLEEKLDLKSSALQKAESDLSEESRLKFDLTSKLSQALLKIENLSLDLHSTKASLSSKTSENSSLASDLLEKSKIIESLTESLETEKNIKKSQSEDFKTYIEELKFSYEQTIITSKLSNDDTIQDLHQEIRTLKSELATSEKDRNLSREKLQQSQENFLIKMKVLQDENAFLSLQIQQNIEKNQEDLAFSQKKFENFKAVTEKQQELALQEAELIRDQLSQEIKHLSRQIQSINDLRLRENENSAQIIKDIKENMEIVLRNTTDHYESKIAELNKEILAMQSSMDSLSLQCDKKIKECNRSFKEMTITKIISSTELAENVYPASSPMRSPFQ